MNTDISGIGVRISFYLQTIFLGEQLRVEILPRNFPSNILFSLSLRKVPRAF
jgi:hypothetical protein